MADGNSYNYKSSGKTSDVHGGGKVDENLSLGFVSESLTEYNEKSVLFTSINKAKFRKPVLPNEKTRTVMPIFNWIPSLIPVPSRPAHTQNTKP